MLCQHHGFAQGGVFEGPPHFVAQFSILGPLHLCLRNWPLLVINKRFQEAESSTEERLGNNLVKNLCGCCRAAGPAVGGRFAVQGGHAAAAGHCSGSAANKTTDGHYEHRSDGFLVPVPCSRRCWRWTSPSMGWGRCCRRAWRRRWRRRRRGGRGRACAARRPARCGERPSRTPPWGRPPPSWSVLPPSFPAFVWPLPETVLPPVACSVAPFFTMRLAAWLAAWLAMQPEAWITQPDEVTAGTRWTSHQRQ